MLEDHFLGVHLMNGPLTLLIPSCSSVWAMGMREGGKGGCKGWGPTILLSSTAQLGVAPLNLLEDPLLPLVSGESN